MYITSKKKVFVVALFYSLIVVCIPWDSLRGGQFVDYLNYIYRINEFKIYGESYVNPSNTFLGAVFSEIVWGYMLFFASYSPISPEMFLTLVSYFCLFSISYFILLNTPLSLGVLLLTNPLIIDFVMSQHRNAFAYAIFLHALISSNRWMFYGTMVLTPLIHTASIFLYSSFIFCKYIVNTSLFRSFLSKKMLMVLAGVTFGLVFALGKEIILGSVGDRRANVNHESVSLVYAAFWFCTLVYILCFSKKKYNPVLYLTVLILTIFTVLCLFNSSSLRFLVMAYPFLIVCLFQLKKDYAFPIIGALIFYQYIQWAFWFNLKDAL